MILWLFNKMPTCVILPCSLSKKARSPNLASFKTLISPPCSACCHASRCRRIFKNRKTVCVYPLQSMPNTVLPPHKYGVFKNEYINFFVLSSSFLADNGSHIFPLYFILFLPRL